MARDFNGVNQYLQVGSAVVTSAPLTMACWFNCDSATVTGILVSITNSGVSGNVTRFALGAAGTLAGDPLRIWVSDTLGNNGTADTTSGYTAGTWHHGCGVFASTTSRSVYIDGGSSATNTTSITPTLLERTNIGVQFLQGSGGISFFDGKIAEVGIWNAALTSSEVSSLAKGMTCDKVRPQSLVFYAPLVRDIIDPKGGITITNNNAATVFTQTRVYA